MTWCGVPGASSRACRGILALALRLESWGTPSELFLSVNNVPHCITETTAISALSLPQLPHLLADQNDAWKMLALVFWRFVKGLVGGHEMSWERLTILFGNPLNYIERPLTKARHDVTEGYPMV